MSIICRNLWVVLLTLVVAHADAAERVTLKHDDGSQESKRSMTGAGQAVRFECPDDQKWYVRAISVHGSRYGAAQPPNEDFQVIVANDDLSQRQEINRPYRLFKRGKEDWVRIGVDPVEVEGAFHVATFFNPTQTKGVYVGIDTDSAPTHSAVLLASDPGEKKSDLEGDWMIRVHLTNEISGEALTLVDNATRAEQEKQTESARDAEILGDARSLTLKHDNGEMDAYRNIGGALYTVKFQTPKDVEGYVWQVQIYASQFGGKHNSEEVSGDVYILDENREIITRTTFPYSLATQQKRWISIPTLPTKVHGKFYVSIDAHGGRFKGLYMGYEEGNPKQIASTDERDGNKVQPAEWSKKFDKLQWMIRAKIADRPVVY